MAPEQWQSRELGPAADVWAFGVTLYEMLAGRRPFRGSPVEIYEQVTDEALKVEPPSTGGAPVPGSLARLCLRCLARDPSRRPTAAHVAGALAEQAEADGRPRLAEGESPFRGLSPFKRAHADLFFGREPEIAACVERLRETPLLAVVGASGAGKSSFVG
jgi:serine/threonine protein kinase